MVKRGFSLTELLVAAGISIILLGVIGQAFAQGWRSYNFTQTASELQRQLRTTLDYITISAESAATVATTVTINGTSYSSGAHVVVFRSLPVNNSTGNLIAGDDYIVIGQRAGAPTITEAVVSAVADSSRATQASQRTLTDLTSSLTIHYYALNGTELLPGADDLTTARSITVAATVSKQTGSAVSQRTLQTTVFLRNKTG